MVAFIGAKELVKQTVCPFRRLRGPLRGPRMEIIRKDDFPVDRAFLLSSFQPNLPYWRRTKYLVDRNDLIIQCDGSSRRSEEATRPDWIFISFY